jgi:hypothetical protein
LTGLLPRLLQFLSLLQNDLIRDMVVIYADKQIHTALKFGVPVCGHPTIVHVSSVQLEYCAAGSASTSFLCSCSTQQVEAQRH